ncbi:helix-turn-helix domain-containing protein [Catenuloplanes atrovinosus]|uniref:AraC-like DNA-binding protein n=1 Tax=Catenuloplanes atrovinosus TaxID=137266 RepID=A0AAE3YNE2_9ACTN|nr:helix-turn-helix domain-containing protein [Catenuloplanes atrovinosus]MDR7275244.1 AraC-like DNA-binding protein [Catenuloplanes atrovinosus]
MVIHLDTRDLPPEHRADALREAMLKATVPAAVRLEQPAEARLGFWRLGTATSVYSHEGSGLQLSRGPDELREAAPDLVALAVQTSGVGDYRQHGICRTVRAGDLMLVDLTAPYDYRWTGTGGSFAVQVEHGRLGLPVETIRRAARHLDRDPATYRMLRDHLVQLRRDVDGIDALPGPAALVGTATASLVRALIMTAADQPADADDRLARIRYWVMRHLGDPDLSPARIADEHDISLRTLYNLWRHPTLSLAQWIMRERLEAVRRDLTLPSPQPIGAIAQRWGFADATHFSRRFRAEYGISAREWRHLHRG